MKTGAQLLERERNARKVWAKRLKVPVVETKLNDDGTNPNLKGPTEAKANKKVEVNGGAKAADLPKA